MQTQRIADLFDVCPDPMAMGWEAYHFRSTSTRPGRDPRLDGIPIDVEDELYLTVPGVTDATIRAASPFVDAFQTVWQELPSADKLQFVRYWNSRDEMFWERLEPFPHRKPVIHLRPDYQLEQPHHYCRLWARELIFPLSLIRTDPSEIKRSIATALANAMMFANRERWRLEVDIIDDPIMEWERAQPGEVDDDARDAQIDILEPLYEAAFQAGVDAIMRRWGYCP